MKFSKHLGPGVRSVDSVRELMGIPRPASVRDMFGREIKLRYVGFHCFGETDEISASDEPYITFGVVATVTERSGTRQTRVHENIDAGESVAEVIDLYRGLPLGATVSVTLAEHDEGDPNKYRDNVAKAVDIATDKAIEGLAEIPVIGFALAALGTVASVIVGPAITDAVNDLLGTDDDFINTVPVVLTAVDMLRHSRTPQTDFHGIKAHIESPLISDGEASYKVYFDVVPA